MMDRDLLELIEGQANSTLYRLAERLGVTEAELLEGNPKKRWPRFIQLYRERYLDLDLAAPAIQGGKAMLLEFCLEAERGGWITDGELIDYLVDAFRLILSGEMSADEALELKKRRGRPRRRFDSTALSEDDDVMPWLHDQLATNNAVEANAIYQEAAEKYPKQGRGWETLKDRYNERREWYEVEAFLHEWFSRKFLTG